MEDDKGPEGVLAVHSSCAMGTCDFLAFPGRSCDSAYDENEGETNSRWDIVFMECCLHGCNTILESLPHFRMFASIEVDIVLFLLSATWAAGILFGL